jgi:hypothetical protein
MNWPKVSLGAVFLAAGMGFPLLAGQQPAPVPPPATTPMTGATPAPSPGIIEGMLAKSSSQSGYLDAQQVKNLMDQVRFAEYRINDLLTDVHPDRWKMSETAQNSFGLTLGTLKSQMQALTGWRTEFTARPASMYAGYETYATMDAVLPRLEGVARTVSQADNSSFGAQFSEAADHLFDLQQKLGAYLEFLLQNQDSIMQALENNLAGCQNDLGRAMRGQTEHYKWKRNSAPVRAHRTTVRSSEKKRRASEQEKKTPPPDKNP